MPISPDDPIYALRVQLAREIVRSLGGSFSQHFISKDYGIPQPRMSELCRDKVQRCTVEWLIRRVYRMGGTVRLTVTLGDTFRAWHDARFERALARMRERRKK